jgi:hypothetical protein
VQCALYYRGLQLKVAIKMRSTIIGALFGLSLLPAAALAQTGPQTAAVESTAPAAATPSAGAPLSGSITREQYLQRAQQRAAQRAAAHFDEMDANHDGVLDRGEIRAWRSQHPRRTAPQPAQPPAQ